MVGTPDSSRWTVTAAVEARQRDLTIGGGKRPADEEDADEGEDEGEDDDPGEDSQDARVRSPDR
jgi:hypothetical protein